jgi:hypothetical protein
MSTSAPETPVKKIPIPVPPIDPEKIALLLHEQQEAVQAELRRLAEAKTVSQETMRREINY